MSELIKIMPSDKPQRFTPVEGERTAELMSRFTKLNAEEKETVLSEAVKILSHCINPIDTIGSITNIAVGYVQSGKTMSFTTLSALAVDNGFRVIIYLAGVKNNLLRQTTNRLTKDLLNNGANSRYYKQYENPTFQNHAQEIQSALLLTRLKPTILITVLKHSRHIDDLSRIFQNRQVKQALGNNGVLIIDDEADQASLNTYARRNSKNTDDWDDPNLSSTYSSIVKLKDVLSNHSYIQYTATPQGPLLINIMDLLSPKYHTVLTPGRKYTGGKTFFIDNPDLILAIPPEQVYHSKNNDLTECPESLIDALQIYLIGVAVVVHIEEREKFLSMMIHADSKNDASRKFRAWVSRLKDTWSRRLDLPDGDPSKTELINQFRKNYDEAIRRVSTKHSFNAIIELMPDTIRDSHIDLVIQNSDAINWNNASSHILVGAEMLNRGFTIENLAVTYMPRYSIGKSTADTIQQRCRFFGYKLNYLDVCRVYLPLESAEEYRDYVQHEEIMRQWLLEKDTLEDVAQVLILDERLNATRKNILSVDVVQSKLNGWRQLNALHNIEENKQLVDAFLTDKTFINYQDFGTDDRRHRYMKADVQEVIQFLKAFKLPNLPDALRKSATIQYLRYLVKERVITYVYMIQMAYKVPYRTRSLDIDKMKIGNIFSGHSPSGAEVYPGDQGIKFEDSLCIQIHKLQFDNSQTKNLPPVIPEYLNRTCYTFGIYYPEQFAVSYIANEDKI
ncbi:MAG: Z1 domain-containing protein [Prevotellaceae bacterium]|jgi:hypothetical protein|nr:Z1 domain-containing protein [Prevotellaceae bacterium]